MGMNKAGEGMVHRDQATLHQQLAALAQLGTVMGHIGRAAPWPGHACGLSEAEYADLDRAVREARIHNGWATEENVRHAFTT